MELERSIRLGIDIGGTFTDLVALDGTGKTWRVKVPTTPADPALGALESVRRFLEQSKVGPGHVKVVIHATTLASNALIQGEGPRTALITTKGFRDVLEIGRQNRPELYNLQVERLRPLVPRRYRFEVTERISYDGRVIQPIDRSQVQNVARKLRREQVESVAVCFLHSYTNPGHEKIAAGIVRAMVPEAHVSVSSELLPEFREYERTSTTVVNAVLQPVISKYLTSLESGLRGLGIRAPLFVMQSNGGTILSSQAVSEPARIIESGPVAGAVASRHYGRRSKGIISLDVGGTTSKAGAWSGDRFEVTTEYEVGGRIHGIRRLEGSGYPVKFPFVDLVEVGTGGGSYAHVDDTGVLHVGPGSAGASPGPACYGRGGTLPTVTDANLVLGRLNPEYLLGGELRLDAELAERALRDHVARRMGRSLENAAAGVLRVAVANMTGVLRAVSIERGYDPREMTLVSFGGAGPMHSCEVALQMGIHRVIVPPRAGLLSSLGLLLSEPLHDFVKTMLRPAGTADLSSIESAFRSMEKKGRAMMLAEQVQEDAMVFERFFDMRYQGQAYELSIEVPRKRVDTELVGEAVRSFHLEHENRYGYSDLETEVEIVNVRVYCRGRFQAPTLKAERPSTRNISPLSRRRVFVDGKFVDDCPVYVRHEIGPGLRGKGPCVIEDYDSTLVIPRGLTYEVDEMGSFRMVIPPAMIPC
jgi:N-methylhydantoinase A